MLIWTPKSKKMVPPAKLQVSNIIMTPSNMLRVLEHLEDYYHKNMTNVPKDGEEWPGPNLFYRDTFNFKTLHGTADHHSVSEFIRGGVRCCYISLSEVLKAREMLPPTKLQVTNIVMTSSNTLLLLQRLDDYYYANGTRVPKNDNEWPGPNLFYKDTPIFKTLQVISAEHYKLPAK